MGVVAWHLARSAIVGWFTLLIGVVSLLLLLRFRVSSVWLLVGAGLLGWFARIR
jgi:chromate transporter